MVKWRQRPCQPAVGKRLVRLEARGRRGLTAREEAEVEEEGRASGDEGGLCAHSGLRQASYIPRDLASS